MEIAFKCKPCGKTCLFDNKCRFLGEQMALIVLSERVYARKGETRTLETRATFRRVVNMIFIYFGLRLLIFVS